MLWRESEPDSVVCVTSSTDPLERDVVGDAGILRLEEGAGLFKGSEGLEVRGEGGEVE